MAEDRAGADPVTTDEPLDCPRCGAPHWLIACPFVKAVEFEDADERLVRRVEFLTPADYPRAVPAGVPEPDYPKLKP